MVANQKLLNKIWFAYISGLIMWVVLTYNYNVQEYLNNHILAYVTEEFDADGKVIGKHTGTADFLLYYNDGLLSWECLKQKIDVWDPQLQNAYLQKLVPNVKLEKIFYSQYPPYLMVLMMPLPLLPLNTTFIVWELLGLAGIIFSIYSILATTLKGKFERAFSYAAVLASFPAWLCFKLGQVALAIYPALMWYWISLDRKYWFRAGVLGGFCLLKLQYAPILFLTGCILGGVRFAAGYTVMGLIYLIGCVSVLGIDNVLNYPKALKMGEITGGQITGVSPDAQQNLRGQLVIMTGNDGSLVHMVVVAVWGIATLFTAFLWWQYKKELRSKSSVVTSAPGSAGFQPPSINSDHESRQKFMILASITMLLQLVTSPHTHRQDYLFISLPAIWLIYSVVGNYPVGDPAMPGASKKLILFIRYMLLGFPIYSWFFFLISQFFAPPIQLFFVWAIFLLVALAFLWKDINTRPAEVSTPKDN